MFQTLVIFHFEVVFDQNSEEKLLVVGLIQYFDGLSVVKTIDLWKRYFTLEIVFSTKFMETYLDRVGGLAPLMP